MLIYTAFTTQNFWPKITFFIPGESDTLDNMLLDQRVDVMKIDIEGAEVTALKGAQNTLNKLRKIVVEIHGDNNNAIEHILLEHGFNIQKTAEKRVIGSKNF